MDKSEVKKMKILIMCGGRGKRLGTMTKKVPKPLVKIDNRTILDLKIEQYQYQGFRNFVFCIGYKGELIRKSIEKKSGIHAEFSDAGEKAGILARIFHAKQISSDQVLITYGDTFTDINLCELFFKHLKSGNEVTIVTAPIKNPFGLVEFNHDNKVISFKEKPILNYYIGYAIINKSALDLVPQKVIDMPDGKGLVTFFKILMGMELLGSYFHSGLQTTFNTKDELKKAKHKMIRFYTLPGNTSYEE